MERGSKRGRGRETERGEGGRKKGVSRMRRRDLQIKRERE